MPGIDGVGPVGNDLAGSAGTTRPLPEFTSIPIRPRRWISRKLLRMSSNGSRCTVRNGRSDTSIGQRALHALRHRLALRRVRKLGRPSNIVFVCYGNICRSPYAARSFYRTVSPELRGSLTVASAGLLRVGRRPPPSGISVASEHGIDLSDHVSAALSAQTAKDADMIVVMEGMQRGDVCRTFGANPKRVFVLGDFDDDPRQGRNIVDPVNGPRAEFEHAYQRIDRCVRTLVRAVCESAGPAARSE